MTIRNLLDSVHIDRSDAELLLAHALGRDRTWLFAHPEYELTKNEKTVFARLVARRARHEPVAYILGYKDFYGLRLKVNRSVLIPRPETELLVDLALRRAGLPCPATNIRGRGLNPGPTRHRSGVKGQSIVFDIGTGTGAIAIAIAKTVPGARVVATDVSPAALRVARENARRHGVGSQIVFRVGAGFSLRRHRRLKPAATKNLIICANLPYLTTAQWQKTAPDVRNYEPRLALDGGRDGLRHYRALLTRVGSGLVPDHGERRGGVQVPTLQLLLEIDPSQTKKLRTLVRRLLPHASVEFHKDLSGRTRVAEIRASS